MRHALACLVLLLAGPVAAGCGGTALSSSALEAEVAALLQRQAAVPFEQVEAALVGEVPADVVAPVLQVKGVWPAPRVAVQVEWDACGTPRRQVLWFKARAWRQAWVFARDAAQDQPLAAAQAERRRVDMALWRAAEGRLAASPGPEWLARPVKAGAPVRTEDLKPAPLVRRNERVTVQVQARGVQLRAAGKALQFGAAGEWVAVWVDGAEKSMRAQVVAPGVVHVEI